jgi:hypothetical protein
MAAESPRSAWSARNPRARRLKHGNCDDEVTARLPADAGTKGAYPFRMMDLLTGDAGLAIFTAVGIVVTAVSIVRDAKEQKARLVTAVEEIPVELPRAA